MGRPAPIHPLTSLRFFAAISVVLYHTYAAFLPSKPFPGLADDVIGVGFLGVSFFFVLSGFILAVNYLEPPGHASAALNTDPRTFFVARLARIYPLYLLALAIHAPFVASHRFAADPNPAIAISKLLISFGANAALVQAWSQSLMGGWNFPGWSLSAEAFFYAMFPFVAPVLWRSRHRDRTLLLALYASASIAPGIATWLLASGRLQAADVVGFEQFPLWRLPEFLFGVVLARSYLSPNARGALRLPAALWIGGALLIATGIALRPQIPNLVLNCGLLMPAFGLILLGFARGDGALHRLLSRRSFVLLGEASYGIYVLHIPLAHWFHYFGQEGMRLSGTIVPFATDQPIGYVAYLAALIGLSVASVRKFEEPARHWIRSLDRRLREQLAEAAGGVPGSLVP